MRSQAWASILMKKRQPNIPALMDHRNGRSRAHLMAVPCVPSRPRARQTAEALLDADRLSDQDHGHPTIHPLPLNKQDLAHKRSPVHDLADLGILPRQDVLADAP